MADRRNRRDGADGFLHPLPDDPPVRGLAGQRYGPSFPIVVVETTNRMASVPGALRSRFAEHVHLDFYPPAELAEVAMRTAVRMHMLLTAEAADFIGQNAGGEPRKVNRRILRGARNLVRGFMPTVDLEVVKRALELSGALVRWVGGEKPPSSPKNPSRATIVALTVFLPR